MLQAFRLVEGPANAPDTSVAALIDTLDISGDGLRADTALNRIALIDSVAQVACI